MKTTSIQLLFSVWLVLLFFLCSSSGYTLYGSSQNITFYVETFTMHIDPFYKNETFLFNDFASPSTWGSQNLATFDQYRGIYIYPVVVGSTTYLFQVSIALNQPLTPILLSKDPNYEVISLTWSLYSSNVYFTVIDNKNRNCTLYSFSPYSLQVKKVVDLLSIGFQAPFAFISAAHYYYYGVNCEFNQTSGLYSTTLLYFPLSQPDHCESFEISISGAIPLVIYFDPSQNVLFGLATNGDFLLFEINLQEKNTTIISYITGQLSCALTAFDFETGVFYFIAAINVQQQTLYAFSTMSGDIEVEFPLPLPLVNIASDGSYSSSSRADKKNGK